MKTSRHNMSSCVHCTKIVELNFLISTNIHLKCNLEIKILIHSNKIKQYKSQDSLLQLCQF